MFSNINISLGHFNPANIWDYYVLWRIRLPQFFKSNASRGRPALAGHLISSFLGFSQRLNQFTLFGGVFLAGFLEALGKAEGNLRPLAVEDFLGG